ncbi:MAG TPA: TldD/PmbA family protein [Pyrinomonadaceae bacterium]|jgi:predicted Zn-dependent protease|nr:TldD/PmbA family protein [Pyrinomonadaceae bacterium]
MALLSAKEAETLLQKVLAFSKSDEMEATLTGGRRAWTRFGVNSASTSGDTEDLSLAVNAHFGQRSGVATSNTLDDKGIERVVRAAEEIARLRPEDPEQMPFLGKQKYQDNPIEFDEATYEAGADVRAAGIAATIEPSRQKNLVAAGIYDNAGGFTALANTRGNFAYTRNSLASFTTTVRTADGTGSGWGSAMSHRIADINARAVGARAVEKAELSKNPVAIEPGNYTVILEPNAVGDLVSFMLFFFDARQADEGRSFLSKQGGGNRVGEKFFGDQVNIYTDPFYASGPGDPFDNEGLANTRFDIVRAGVVKTMNYSRFWAKKQGKEPTPGPANLIMDGGSSSIEDMIKSTERGILVTRLWYIRLVDPQTVLLTGLTRDGTFLIEKGRLKSAIKNFRFNETPVKMLNNIEMMSPSVRITGSERVGEQLPVVAPALKVRDFAFTSLSDAV